MRVDVFSRHDACIGTIGERELLAFEHTDELNGEDSVSIETTFHLREGYRLVWKDRLGRVHEHVCQDPKALHGGALVSYTDTALNSICELYGDYIEDKRPHSYSFRKALEVCLEPTRWEVGTVDQPGTVASGLTFYHVSAREALQSILECGGELETGIEVGGSGVTRRTVSIRAHRGETGGHRRFAYGKDVSLVSKTEHWGAITACYGYGKGEETDAGGYGRKLTFGDINGGLDYVADREALEQYGRPDGKGGFAHYFGVYENGECEDASQLLSETQAYLDEHKVPGVTYEADVLDLVAFGRSWEGVSVGDDVQLVDTEFSPELRCEGRVTKLVTDLLGGTQTVTLGNVVETLADIWQQQQQQISNLNKHSSNWDIAATTPGAYLQQIIDGLNEQFNVAGMSYCFTSFETGTIWSSVPLDENGKPTKTGGSAMQICSQGFRIAGGTKSDGSYDWRTFGTGEGFTADAITTGTLNAGLVRAGVLRDASGESYWDLDSGEMRISMSAAVGDRTMQGVSDAADEAGRVAAGAASAADDAMGAAGEAARTATDYITMDSGGIVVGDSTGRIKANTRITPDGVDVRSGSDVLASFARDDIELGRSADSSRIRMAGGRLTISTGERTGMVKAREVRFATDYDYSLYSFMQRGSQGTGGLEPIVEIYGSEANAMLRVGSSGGGVSTIATDEVDFRPYNGVSIGCWDSNGTPLRGIWCGSTVITTEAEGASLVLSDAQIRNMTGRGFDAGGGDVFVAMNGDWRANRALVCGEYNGGNSSVGAVYTGTGAGVPLRINWLLVMRERRGDNP